MVYFALGLSLGRRDEVIGLLELVSQSIEFLSHHGHDALDFLLDLLGGQLLAFLDSSQHLDHLLAQVLVLLFELIAHGFDGVGHLPEDVQVLLLTQLLPLVEFLLDGLELLVVGFVPLLLHLVDRVILGVDCNLLVLLHLLLHANFEVVPLMLELSNLLIDLADSFAEDVVDPFDGLGQF